ncbi:hypothetical protein E8E12_005437 [Didymella heteroderae]|uniref:MARVEL domain-containing protein n=1 Tax=Didymella heteroderae TaxID=1769908 RepID=A0A9P5BY09_9PLEO|nr:hypothetical protein E8E12_005437 [Didymella heteroderae]
MKVFDNFYAFADRFNRLIHITQALLVLIAFIVGCALMANTSMPRSRSTTLVLVYSIKSAVFLLYQYLSTHVERFRRWASLKANFILDAFDCLLWFTAFVISCMGGGRCVGSSCALMGLAATVALLLSCAYFITAVGINWPKWRASKKVLVQSNV